MITPKQMIKLKRQEPFRPFRVVLKNGERFEVLDRLEFLPLRDELDLPVRRRPGGQAIHGTNRLYEDIDRIEMLDEQDRGAA